MDAVRGNYGYSARETTPRREVQRADLVEKARAAAQAEALSEAEIEELTAFCNSTLQDVDQLRKPKYPQDVSSCFPRSLEEIELRNKLRVRLQDNSTAREVKQGYSQLLNDLSGDSATARQMVDKMGPGTHTLSNGDVVEISRDDSGNLEVFTRSPDGSSKKVFYNSENPKDVRVQNTSADHQMCETERKGQTLTETRNFRETTTYSMEEDRVVRVECGPALDDHTKTTVNPDGSTQTRELIYVSDEPGPDGEFGVYNETQEPARSIGVGGSGGVAPRPDGLGTDKRPPYILGGAVGGAVSSSLGGIALDGQVGVGGGVGPRPNGLGTDKRPPYILGDSVGGSVGHSVGGTVTGGPVGGGAGGASMGGPVGHSVGGTAMGGQAGDRVGGVADEVPPAASAE